MSISKRTFLTALSLAGALAADAAQARDNVELSVQIRSPGFVLGLPLPPLPFVVVSPSRTYSPDYGHAPYYRPAPVYGHAPVYSPAPVYGYGHGGYHRDRYDHVYNRVSNPHWDRDGDGIPNRYDRYPDHAYGRHHDRDRDGVPDWRDNNRGDHRGDRDRGQRDNRRGGHD